MPTFRVKCSFVRTVTLLVEAPDKRAIYKATESDDFNPDALPCEDDHEEWDSVDPVVVEPGEGLDAEVGISEDGLSLEAI